MPIVQANTSGASRLAALLLQDALSNRQLAFNTRLATDARRNALLSGFAEAARAAREREEARAARDTGLGGSEIGAIAGLALAPFTGGLSLAALGTGAAVGSTIGGLIDQRSPGAVTGPQAAQAFATLFPPKKKNDRNLFATPSEAQQVQQAQKVENVVGSTGPSAGTGG